MGGCSTQARTLEARYVAKNEAILWRFRSSARLHSSIYPHLQDFLFYQSICDTAPVPTRFPTRRLFIPTSSFLSVPRITLSFFYHDRRLYLVVILYPADRPSNSLRRSRNPSKKNEPNALSMLWWLSNFLSSSSVSFFLQDSFGTFYLRSGMI